MKRHLPARSPVPQNEWFPTQPAQSRRVKSISFVCARSARMTALNLFIRRLCARCVGKGSQARGAERSIVRSFVGGIRSFHSANGVIKYRVVIRVLVRSSAEAAWLSAGVSGAELSAAHIARRDGA